MFSNNILRIII